jgi:simple sugar transport system permease protein
VTAAVWIAILAGAVTLATPIIIAGLGESLVERAGRLNLGIEGMMIMGAFTAVWVGTTAGPWGGLAAAGVVGALLAVVMNIAVYGFRANEVIVGLAITMLGLGLSTFLFQLWIPAGQTNQSVPLMSSVPLGSLADIPFLGPVLFDHVPVVYATALLIVVFWAIRRFTTFGLKVHAAGVDPQSANLRGVRVASVGQATLIVGGALAGIAGGVITVVDIGSFTPNITAGRGYIVLAVVIMGRMTPLGVALGALLFATFESFSLLAQGFGPSLPSEIYETLPYVVTLVVLVISSRAQVRALARRLA